MDAFTYNGQPGRVIFGSGTVAQLRAEVERLGLQRVLVLSTHERAGLAHRLAETIAERTVGVFTNAAMHTPTAVTDQAMEIVRTRNVDGLVAVGGGSTTGLGKAIALRTDLPQIVVPTTYAGSEMTPILGETKDGIKTTRRDARILPETVIYDVQLTLSLPRGLSGTSGINAIAHAIEASYAQDRNPIISVIAVEGVRALAQALPDIARDPSDGAARWNALYGAFLCGLCLGSVGMALHHKLCHVLGGAFDLPHSETHTVILPYAIAYNAPCCEAALAPFGAALGTADLARFIYDLARSVGAPRSLEEIGMPAGAIDRATDLALANPYWNPRPLEREGIRALLSDAYSGNPPAKA